MAESSPTASVSDASHPDFGSNAWLVEDMYERFTEDPSSVDEKWSAFFREGGYGSGGAATSAR